MERETQDYEEKADEATEAPGEGAGWEEGSESEGTESGQWERADK